MHFQYVSGAGVSCFLCQIQSIESFADNNLWLYLYHDCIQCVPYDIIYQLLWNDFSKIGSIVDAGGYGNADSRMIYDIHHEDFMLFRYLLIVVTLGYLGFAMLHPDYWVARYNIATIERGGVADVYYLQTRLSADSAPAIAAMDNVEVEETGYRLENLQREYFKRIQEENEQMHIRNWNLSRAAAGYYAKKALVN